MIDFRLLRHFWYFLAVAEERHFGKAANRLGMSQPPLSQQIQVLEQMLGVKLFERSVHGAKLTPQGLELLVPVQRFMEHADRLQSTVLETRDGRSESITIGAINSALFDIVPSLRRIAQKRFPRLSISLKEMDSASALTAVQNGEIEIALARFDPLVGPLKMQPIQHDHLVVVLPFEHRLTKRDRIALDDLADEGLVLFPRWVSPSYFDHIVAACRKAGFSPRVQYEVSSVVSQIAFVGCGMAVGLVPSRSMRFGGGDVVFRSLVEAIEVVTIAAVWNPAQGKEKVPLLIDIAARIGAGIDGKDVAAGPPVACEGSPRQPGDRANAPGPTASALP